MRQLTIDFSQKPIISGKKTQRLSMACSDELFEAVDLAARMYGVDRAEFIFNALIDGLQKATGNALLAQQNGNKTLSELLSKG